MAVFAFRSTVITFLIVLFCLISLASGEKVEDPVQGYSLNVPDGWIAIPKDVLDARLGATTSPEAARTFNYVAAYQSSAATEGYFRYPYMLVQITPYPNDQHIKNISEDELRKIAAGFAGLTDQDLRQGLSSQGSNLLQGAHGQTASYFTSPPGFRGRMVMDVAGIGPLHTEIKGLVGRDHLVAIDFYAKEPDWSDMQLTFEQLAVSFHLIGDQPVALGENSSGSGFNWNHVSTSAITGALIGGIGALFGLLRKKKKSA